MNVRTVNDLVARNFTSTIVDDRQSAVAVHGDDLALTVSDRRKLDITNCAVDASFVLRRLFKTSRTTDVECAYRQLRSWFANRLSGDNTPFLTNVYWMTGHNIASI